MDEAHFVSLLVVRRVVGRGREGLNEDVLHLIT